MSDSNMSRVVRKPDFCICENKDADQLRSNCAADQRLCFRYIDSTIPLLPKSEISSLYPYSEGLYYLCSENKGADQLRSYCAADLRLCFRICTARFVWDLLGNPEDRFSHNEAHIIEAFHDILRRAMTKIDVTLSIIEHGHFRAATVVYGKSMV